uniref:K Homology domain-containing protein n=1 Tax=Glossina austeni TaxID=7395 RepID=A0A1A9VGB2_GLOAU
MKSKRDNHSNDDGPHPDKRNRRNDDQVRVLIPSNIAGAIIGKGGQHIQKMRTQRDDEYDVRLLIHQSLAGCIIGKGGQKIKEIRDVSNPFIMTDSEKDIKVCT